jgi:hypothetical protein
MRLVDGENTATMSLRSVAGSVLRARSFFLICLRDIKWEGEGAPRGNDLLNTSKLLHGNLRIPQSLGSIEMPIGGSPPPLSCRVELS